MSDHSNDLILVEHQEGCHVVRFLSENLFDPLVVADVEKQVQDLIAEEPTPRLVLTLDTLKHVASSTLGSLISIRSASQGKGGDAVLAGVPASILEILKIARLDGVFRIYETPSEAVSALTTE